MVRDVGKSVSISAMRNHEYNEWRHIMEIQNKWSQDRFEISSFYVLPVGGVSEEAIKLYADANFTLVEANTPIQYRSEDFSDAENLEILRLCEKYGLRYVITDHNKFTGKHDSDEAELSEVIGSYSDYPSFSGYYVWDEPRREDFAAAKEMVKYFNEKDPSSLCLIAMYPSYGPYKHPREYEEFLQEYVDVVNPQVLSYDYYPFRNNTHSSTFYWDFEVNRKIALRKGIPMWFYIQACQRPGWDNPTVSMIRYQAFSALAYGAKGIQYFIYRDIVGKNPEFVNAVVDSESRPTRKYEGIKALNGEILKLGPTLMKLTSIGVYHSGSVPSGCRGLDGNPLVSKASDNLLIGLFEDPDSIDYLLVVNKDYESKQEVCLCFNKKVKLQEVSEQTDSLSEKLSVDCLELCLSAGAGRLFRVQ